MITLHAGFVTLECGECDDAMSGHDPDTLIAKAINQGWDVRNNGHFAHCPDCRDGDAGQATDEDFDVLEAQS